MFWKQVRLAIRNLGRNRRRNIATASAIILGYAGLILLSGFVVRIEKFFRATSVYLNHVGSLSVYRPGGVEKHLLQPQKYNLSADEARKVKAIVLRTLPDVEAISSTLTGFTLIGNGCKTIPVKVLGVEPALDRQMAEHPAVQQYASEIVDARKGTSLWQHPDVTPIVVTHKVARNLGKEKLRQAGSSSASPAASTISIPDCTSTEGQELIAQDPNVQVAAQTYRNDLSAIDAEIVGHYSSGLELLEESTGLMPLQALQKLFETNSVTNVIVYLPWDNIPELSAEKLRRALKEENLELEVHHYRELSVNPFYAGFMNLIYVMSVFFLALAVSVVTLTVTDAMTMSVLERSREIGTLRALGFKQSEIIRIFALEGHLLAVLCLPVGLLLALLTTFFINSSRVLFEVPGVSTQLNVTLLVDPMHCLWIGGLIVAVSTLAGWATSVRTSRNEVVKLLNTHVS